MANEFPPRRRNWKEGTPQVGGFLRTRAGTTITLANDKGSERQETLLFALILGPQKIPEDVMSGLTTWVDSQLKRKTA